jgi:flagellar hook-associated protein 2
MSSATSVDGLISGLSTTSLIQQLMQVEAVPQQNLRTKAGAQQQTQSAYQSVNTKLAAVQTAAQALSSSDTWGLATATASSDAVTATAGSGATGQLTFDVTKLATTHSVTISPPSAGLMTGGGVDITIGAKAPAHVPVTTNTVQGVADAINSAGLGVRAAVVQTSRGQVLQLTAVASGAAGAFTVAGFSTSPAVLTQGHDAELTVGTPPSVADPNAAGYVLTSSTNTFTGVLPGVTVRANRLESGVTVTTTANAGGMADKVNALVGAVNDALTEIGKQSAWNSATKKGSPLTGDPMIRQLQQTLLSTISNGIGGGSAATAGVSLTKDGSLKFDRQAFLDSYAADPVAAKKIATGVAAAYQTVATNATDSVSGTITVALQGTTSELRRLNSEITDWTSRLADKQAALQKKYSNLEVSLGKLKDQSNWLAGQLAGLSSNSGG